MKYSVVFGIRVVAAIAVLAFHPLGWAQDQPDVEPFEGHFPHEIGPQLKMDADGFAAFSASLTNKMSREPLIMDIEPYTITLPLVARGIARDMVATVQVNRVYLRPTSGGIHLNVSFDSIAVEIGALRMENYFFSGIGSTCTGAGFTIGDQGRVSATALMGVRLRGATVDLTMRRFQFDMARYQYQAYGPTRCRGGFIIGDLFTQVIAGQVLRHAQVFVADAIERQAGTITSTVEESLNAMSQMEFPLEIPRLVVLPPTSAKVSLQPGALNLDTHGLDLQLAMTVKQVTDGTDSPSEEELIFQDTALAEVSFQEALVNGIFEVLHQEDRLTFEATAEMHPMFAAFKDGEQMASFIPDLANLELDSNELRVFVEPNQAPTFTAQTEAQALGLAMTDMTMRFQVQRDGLWEDYFLMQVTMDFGLAPADVDHQIHLTMVPGNASVTGDFAPGYEPADPSFDAPGMAAFFQALMDVLERTGEPFVVERPLLPMVGFELAPQRLQILEGAVSFEVVEKAAP